MFKNIAKADLRDIFDRCCGDPNWAVSIVLEDMANKQISVLDTQDSSASDDETTELCECLAEYDIIPDISSAPSRTTNNSSSTDEVTSESTPMKQKKSKKHVRKLRRGEWNKSKTENVGNDAKTVEDVAIASTSKVDIEAGSSSSEISETNAKREDGDELNRDNAADTVNFNLGNEFVTHLDEYFGRQDFVYPAGIEPKINIPVSLLEQINALWLESFSEQLDQAAKQTELMIKQDEEFARKLAAKTEEMAKAGKEPEVPDLKEIMDMEFALSLYQKDVEAEWRNKEPKDLAAKLSRDKLSNLFPEASPDDLSQILMAHDNNFQATLETVFISSGLGKKGIDTKDGLNKYMVQKELERQVKIIAEQKKALSEFEWPLLPKHEKVEMSVVEEYRKEADMHLKTRSMIYQKAQEYVNRGMTQVAYYYTEVADLYTRKFEYANCLAAAYLIQVHASNCRDDSYIDLHFLRVAEAVECLDLFLDSHIQRLREASTSTNTRHRSLFFVTGRGIHSAHGLPRIKPATKKRLAERGITFKEVNPGLLTAKVCTLHSLSNELA